MSKASPGRRARAYALTLVTTAIVSLFAVAEWATERFVSEHSRAAGTAIEIAIVIVAALVFRPIHQRIEAAVEGAIYRRKRHALETLTKFRRELSSFSDLEQLLRRVVEAIEHHLEARACAVYLRRDTFHAAASSFEVQAQDVPLDDPLAIRLQSSATPARPTLLKSQALGTHAFPMTAAGELAGFLCTESVDEYDEEETQMLAGLAADLAGAIVTLDPSLRKHSRKIPNNIPTGLPALIGREREVAELKAALEQTRLLTIAGAGGVGKTRLALECASAMQSHYEHGVWFVNLAPIADPALVPATLASTLGIGASDMERVLEFLAPRKALIVIDNCEHVVNEVASVAERLLSRCPDVTLLLTSREILHLASEQIYRLQPLRTEAAVELFLRRANALVPSFDGGTNAARIYTLCERLDGIPLAIELAAARVRTLSVTEILSRLEERFRLLTGGTRTAEPRQQTLAATIGWSYDLLSSEERSLFRRLSAFRGSFTLAAAAAVCSKEGRCDEYHVLDVLTSLADKSLLVVTLGPMTRYRLLETIRDYAAQENAHAQAVAIVAHEHAAYFAAVAAHAYNEFDTRLPHDWLRRLAPDLDNFRAALEWTLEGDGDRRTGAQLAADCGPIFLRLELLGEGLRWCDTARKAGDLPAPAAGRIEYVASMMHNNLGEKRAALQCALAALSYNRSSNDERALVRALSQVAQQYARSQRFDEAKAPAAEAIERARALGEPRVLISVLRRCAFALPLAEIADARTYFSEALELARTSRDPEETCLVLEWWANREASAGSLDRAMQLASDALACAKDGSELTLELCISGWALALNDFAKAKPHARHALTLARRADNPLAQTMALAYYAPFAAEQDAGNAALLFGYAKSCLSELEWQPERDDALALDSASDAIRHRLENGVYESLLQRGAELAHPEAMALLDETISSAADTTSLAGQQT